MTAPPSPTATVPGAPSGRPTPTRLFHLVVLLVFLGSSIAAVTTVMHHYPYPSPIDEIVHFDYVRDFPHVPVNGERVSQEGLREWACRTSGPEYVLPLPACRDGHYNPDEFPGQGFSTAGSTPPVYYGVTAIVARPVSAVTGWDLFTVARATGALWLAGFMFVAYLLALRLRVPPIAAAAAALLVGLAPNVIASAATIGPDTATALASGLVLLSAMTYDRTRRSTWWFLAAVALAAATKFTAFTAVGAALILLVAYPLLERRGTAPKGAEDTAPGHTSPSQLRRPLLTSLAGLAVFGVISFLWGLRFQATSQIDPDKIPINVMLHADSVPWRETFEYLLYVFFSPGTNNWQPQFLNDATNAFIITSIAGLSIVAVLAAALALRDDPRGSALGLGLLVMAVVSPFLLVALNLYANHLYFLLPPRYGYALLPGIVAAIAWLLRGIGPSRALALLAVLSVVNVLT